MTTSQRPVGELLRQWRGRRRLSQLELSLSTDISARHLSFVETGRATPSRDLVLRLSERLDLSLRARNELLLAAGYAPAYPEHALAHPNLGVALDAVRRVLGGHAPFPAVVVDRMWNLVEANAGLGLLLDGVSSSLLEPPVNVLRVALHPAGLASRVINFGQWRAELLGRLSRQVEATGDPELRDLLDELCVYPVDTDGEPEAEPTGQVFAPLRLRHGETELCFFSTVATFGTPLDVTLAELVIESFFPADDVTREYLFAAGSGEHGR